MSSDRFLLLTDEGIENHVSCFRNEEALCEALTLKAIELGLEKEVTSGLDLKAKMDLVQDFLFEEEYSFAYERIDPSVIAPTTEEVAKLLCEIPKEDLKDLIADRLDVDDLRELIERRAAQIAVVIGPDSVPLS